MTHDQIIVTQRKTFNSCIKNCFSICIYLSKMILFHFTSIHCQRFESRTSLGPVCIIKRTVNSIEQHKLDLQYQRFFLTCFIRPPYLFTIVLNRNIYSEYVDSLVIGVNYSFCIFVPFYKTSVTTC